MLLPHILTYMDVLPLPGFINKEFEENALFDNPSIEHTKNPFTPFL